MADNTTGITVKKEDDLPEWYEQVCLKSELVEFSDVKGFMVLRPRGYSVWEGIQNFLNKGIKKHGVQNAAFPLVIPESYFSKEAEHAEGFSPEVAWITHAGSSKLTEKLAVRPTSETIISKSFKRWLRSYKDLPIKVNQWCSVVRWETKQTKLFLRSREFWWQEGHCIYETKDECVADTLNFLEEYRKVSENLLAVPVLTGKKTDAERFAGAEDTYTIESLMPDGKALQAGTSHYLGQGFMKGFEVEFIGKDENMHHPHYNSWGLSTRMLGSMVMVHSDNKGLVLPPRAAENKVVIVPILFDKTRDKVMEKAEEIKDMLDEYNPILDDREDYSPGWKFSDWELKGIPFRIEIGPKDIDKGHVVLVRRDNGEKEFVKFDDLSNKISDLIDMMHDDMFSKAKKFLDENITSASDYKGFEKAIEDKKLVKVPFCGDVECEAAVKDKTNGVTSRCIPFEDNKTKEKCFACGKNAKNIVIFGRSY